MSTVNGFNYLRLINTETPKEQIQSLWETLSKEEYCFDDLTKNNADYFLKMLFQDNTLHFFMEDYGYILVAGIRPLVDATVHYSIWNKKVDMRRVVLAARELFNNLFEKLQLNRLNAPIPKFNKSASRLAWMLGFKFEGCLRQALLMNNHYEDVDMFGLLKSEWIKKEEAYASSSNAIYQRRD